MVCEKWAVGGRAQGRGEVRSGCSGQSDEEPPPRGERRGEKPFLRGFFENCGLRCEVRKNFDVMREWIFDDDFSERIDWKSMILVMK